MVALLVAASVSMITTVLGTPMLIRALQARGLGQQIREDGPQGHFTKAGTPTMGGLIMVLALVVGYAASHVRTGAVVTGAGVLVVAVVIGAGFVGFLDDWIKITRRRSLGLDKTAKTVGLLVVATTFGIIATYWLEFRTDVAFARPIIELSDPAYVVWAVLIIIGTAHAVNLADGLDGLAAGSSIYAYSAFMVIGFWQFRHPECYGVGPALDLSLVAAAMVGACTGFLWWNASPARIFMGDTGALAIGAGLGGLALATNTHLLLPIAGGLFVMITLSVAIQVVAFRLFGRRVFRMAPIHHHFELGGWPETTVIVRFWILSLAFTAVAVGLFYADFLSAAAPCNTAGPLG